MTIPADEGVEREIVDRLRSDGHSVVYVAEMAPGITEEEVLAQANESGAMLLTQDKDFGELVFRNRHLSQGVVLTRLAGLSGPVKAELTSTAFREHGEEMRGAFTVVAPGSVRIRCM